MLDSLDKTPGLKSENFPGVFCILHSGVSMKVDWKPDDQNVYLTNGVDNLALHYDENISDVKNDSRLDHFGIFIKNKDDIDVYMKHMRIIMSKSIKIKRHIDKSVSFYVEDPDGIFANFMHLV